MSHSPKNPMSPKSQRPPKKHAGQAVGSIDLLGRPNSPKVHCHHDKLEDASKLKPNPRNPRTHPQEEIEALARIIKETGWRRAVTVSKRSGLIVRGHGAVQAAITLGCLVPVEIQNFRDAAEEHAHMIADNRLAELAAWNDVDLAGLLQEIKTEGDILLTGFDDGALELILNNLGAPSEFPEADENISKCGYKWSGETKEPS